MKISSPLLLAALIALGGIYFGKPLASANAPQAMPAFASAAPLHVLQRGLQSAAEPPRRDPFFGTTVGEKPSLVSPLTSNSPPTASPGIPALRILGKQEDDSGWSVFISAPGPRGEVWVVRQGEVFGERFRVSKLQPPVLLISSLNGRQTKSFDIGKEEE